MASDVNRKIFESSDFMEDLLRHMAHSSVVYDRCLTLGLRPEDFTLSDSIGCRIYREFADKLLKIKQAPVGIAAFMILLKTESFESGILTDDLKEYAANLINFVFNNNTPVNEQYITDNLVSFIKHRRFLQAQLKHQNDPEGLVGEYNKIITEVLALEVTSCVEVISAYEKIYVDEEPQNIVPTGIEVLDRQIKGSSKGDVNYLVGFSGKGKTMLMVNMAEGIALAGYKVAMLSLEEKASAIVKRNYAYRLSVPYQELHQRQTGFQDKLEMSLNEMRNKDPEAMERLHNNLRLVNMADQRYSCNGIQAWLDDYAKTNNFIPDALLIDQLEFIEPNVPMRGQVKEWEKQQQVSPELFDLARHKINNIHSYTLWVAHQATGDPSMYFARSQVSGFKGLIKNAAIMMGVGAPPNNVEENVMQLFIEKGRHISKTSIQLDVDPVYQRIVGARDKTKLIPIQPEKASKRPTANPANTMGNPLNMTAAVQGVIGYNKQNSDVQK